MTLSLVEIKNNKRFSGVLLDKQGLVYSIDSPTESSKTSIANGGVYMIENDLFRKHLKRGVFALTIQNACFSAILKEYVSRILSNA